MTNRRRPIVALSAALGLVAVQALLDPTGLLALVGWSGAVPQFGRGLWPFAPYVVFLPVFLAMVWWVARRAGERFWTLTVGFVLAVLLAQAATLLAMTGDLANAAWGAGYVTAKAIPAALIIAAITRLFGGRAEKHRHEPGSALVPAVAFAALAPLLAGQWWTAVAFAPGVPTARPESGYLSVLIATAMLAALAYPCIRWMRARVLGILGAWLGAVVAGGALGAIQGVVAVILDGMPSDDLWPAMAIYVGLADGLSFGATVGWVAGVAAVLVDRLSVRGHEGATDRRLAIALAAVALALTVIPVVAAGLATPDKREASLGPAFLRASGGVIADGEGNQVLLRGVNVNQLVDFYAPRPEVPVTTPLTEEDFAGIASYGFNVVRLGMSWSALEPTRGEIDEAYLGQIEDAVAWAKAHDIYVVLDMHQDSWWNEGTPEGFECKRSTTSMWGYDGAPTWATITDGGPRCQFQGRDISPASNRAFQNWYFDTDGVQSALVDTWGVLAEAFADEPTVAGFDLLNEPGFGETAPATTSRQLGRFYSAAIAEIRGAGAGQIVFMEPSILWSGLGFDTGPAAGFTDDPNIVFAPHLYAESITMDASLGIPPIVGMERQFGLGERAATSYDAPLWSGEYGFWGDTENRVSKLTRYAALEDEYRIGGAYWVWKQACGDPQNGIQDIGDGLIVQDCASGEFSGTNEPLLEILSRAYPQAAPGHVTSLTADGATIALAGTASGRSCGLKVWVPGDAEPAPEVSGITDLDVTAAGGGWVVTGCAEGDYSLTNKG